MQYNCSSRKIIC